jgi:hypothetical protein
MRFDTFAPKAPDGLAKQARMLPFFLEPQVRQETGIFRGVSVFIGVPGNQRGRTAAVAELELDEGGKELFDDGRIQIDGEIPLRLRAVGVVGAEVLNPFGGGMRLHRTFRFEVHFALQS